MSAAEHLPTDDVTEVHSNIASDDWAATRGMQLDIPTLAATRWNPDTSIESGPCSTGVSSTCGDNSWHGGMQGVRWQVRARALGGQRFGGPGQSGGSMLSAFANPLSILNATHAGNTGRLLLVQRPASRRSRPLPATGGSTSGWRHENKQAVPEPGDFYDPSCA